MTEESFQIDGLSLKRDGDYLSLSLRDVRIVDQFLGHTHFDIEVEPCQRRSIKAVGTFEDGLSQIEVIGVKSIDTVEILLTPVADKNDSKKGGWFFLDERVHICLYIPVEVFNPIVDAVLNGALNQNIWLDFWLESLRADVERAFDDDTTGCTYRILPKERYRARFEELRIETVVPQNAANESTKTERNPVIDETGEGSVRLPPRTWFYIGVGVVIAAYFFAT